MALRYPYDPMCKWCLQYEETKIWNQVCLWHRKMFEHLHIDYPIGGSSACNKLLEDIDWNKWVDDFSTIEMVKTIGLITIMYDFPELIAKCEVGVGSCT